MNNQTKTVKVEMLKMDKLNDAILKATANRSRLVFFLGDKIDSQELSEHEQLNLNKSLSELLINMPKSERARSVEHLVSSLVSEASTDEVVVNGLEILFDRSLAIDPVRLFEACSKNKTLLVRWPGDKTNSGLSYALPSHPEYRSYRPADLSDVILLESDEAIH